MCLYGWEGKAGRKVMAAYRLADLRTDCLYTGISSGPNAR